MSLLRFKHCEENLPQHVARKIKVWVKHFKNSEPGFNRLGDDCFDHLTAPRKGGAACRRKDRCHCPH